MRFPQTDTDNSICVTVLVTREEYPRLFAVLRQVPKGRRRANRLRALAASGEQIEGSVVLMQGATSRSEPPPATERVAEGAGTLAAAQMFGDPIAN